MAKKYIQVFCSHDKMVSVGKLRPHPQNPNTHPDSQIELLARIIKSRGWRAPITISKRSGFIIRGHARRLAALKLGEKRVPVDIQDYESEAEEYADLVADNRISELAVIDDDKMAEVLKALEGTAEIELTGFDLEDVLSLLAPISGEEDDLLGEIHYREEEKEKIIITFYLVDRKAVLKSLSKLSSLKGFAWYA